MTTNHAMTMIHAMTVTNAQVLRPSMNPAVSTLGWWGWKLRCPECGEECVERHGGDDAAVTVHPDRDQYDSPIGTRGGYVKVELFCPAGHGFDLVIANHKGCEFIGVVPAGERDYGTCRGEVDGD